MHAPSARSSPHALPVLVTILGIGLFAVMDALMKRAASASGVYPALLARSVIGVALVAPLWIARGGRWPAPRILRLHMVRGVLVVCMASTFFWGLVRMPMAEGIALSFISPLIALALAAIFLGERLRAQAIVAAVFGLVGVVVIAWGRLSSPESHAQSAVGIGAILVSAVFYAFNLVLQRQQAQVAGPTEVALFQNGVIALTLLPAAPFLWQGPDVASLHDIAAAALLASASLMLLAWAYARAEAQVLVPVEYTGFLWSALLGWWWFAETVTVATLAGAALIMVGVWYGTRRNPAAHSSPA